MNTKVNCSLGGSFRYYHGKEGDCFCTLSMDGCLSFDQKRTRTIYPLKMGGGEMSKMKGRSHQTERWEGSSSKQQQEERRLIFSLFLLGLAVLIGMDNNPLFIPLVANEPSATSFFLRIRGIVWWRAFWRAPISLLLGTVAYW